MAVRHSGKKKKKGKTPGKPPGATQGDAHSGFSVDFRVKTAAYYAAAVAACLLVMSWVLRLWQADLSVPFAYKGDGLVNSIWIKGIIDNGWYLYNNYLGAPNGLAMADFPTADNLHLFLIKVISLFTGDFAVTLNIFFLLTFPLTTVAALFLFRRLGISYPTAIFGSLLFTFLPYHFFRGESHLFLAAIYIIPLTALLILRLGSDTPPFIKKDDQDGEKFDYWSPRTVGYVLVALLTASAGIYYAFFACFFLIVGGTYAAYRRRSLKRLYVAGIALAIVGVALIVNLSPNFLYQSKNGKNEEAAKRYAIESEMFGLTIGQLVLPITGHRVGFLADIKNELNQGAAYVHETAVFTNENDEASLGLIGCIGLLISLGWLIFAIRCDIGKEKMDLPLMDSLSVMNISGILLATMGGFSVIFALLVSPDIRGYNRISPYIALFSILVVLVILESLRRRFINSPEKSIGFYAILVLVLIVGVLDQTNGSMVPSYSANNNSYASDDAFIKSIENEMPAQAQIFQLPYLGFPENGPVNHMSDYDHFRAYLHSSDLRWSYGVMKGRPGDLWQRKVAYEQTLPLLKDVAAAGYTGIYINRDGYPDNGAKLEQELGAALNEKPLTNAEGTLLFFDISDYAKTVLPQPIPVR